MTFVNAKMKTHALSTAILLFGVSACGQTTVRPLSRSLDASIARPSRILLQTFAVSEAQVNEYQGILRQQPSNNNAMERRREIGKRAAEALAVELVNRLRALSFTVERVSHETLVTDNDLLVEGQFLSVDEGDPLRRLVLGFGSGVSRVETRMQVYYGIQRRPLLDFTTHADSGKMPGAAATMPAGAAIEGGLTAAVVAGTAITTGVKAYRSDVSWMAESGAEQAVYYLSQFFARHGWIHPAQAKEARIAN